ncbi:hypothetical protein MT997_23040 [Paenibacillus sp. OVF10]|nr:hypothetical protein MT997_23040 [Paenibacillus sp. OVF10]
MEANMNEANRTTGETRDISESSNPDGSKRGDQHSAETLNRWRLILGESAEEGCAIQSNILRVNFNIRKSMRF